MLDHFLQQVYAATTSKQAEFELTGLLKELPDMELRKIAAGMPVGELYKHLTKEAYSDCAPSTGEDNTFLGKFKGTPLFDAALALEQEELQSEMADMRERKTRRVEEAQRDRGYDVRDQIRLKKRLLELQLAKQESGGAPEAPAQGAGAPGDVPAEGVQDNSQGIVGSKTAMAFAENMGKLLARSDLERLEKVAHLEKVGTAAGQVLAKEALNLGLLGAAGKGLGQAALGWAKKNPLQAATTVGGAALGAMKGSQGEGGVTGGALGALGGGLAGNVAGKGIGSFIKNRAAGQGLGQAAGNVAMGGIQHGVGLLNS